MIEGWCTRLQKFDRIIVGLSGGLDSTVLTNCLALNPVLANKLQIVHVHHGLSPNADVWAEHCQKLCGELNIPIHIQQVQICSSSNIEEAARKARYQVLKSYLIEERTCLLLGHHRDDQAETLLLQLLRGAGIDGMASMPKAIPCEKGMIIRPFLSYSRAKLLSYAQAQKLSWIEDESNQVNDFSRNFLRNEVFPLIQTRWPKCTVNLARTVEHCQEAKTLLEELALLDCPQLSKGENTLVTNGLLNLSYERLTNVLRLWFKRNGTKPLSACQLKELIQQFIFSKKDGMPTYAWDGFVLKRHGDTLHLLKQQKNLQRLEKIDWPNFPNPLSPLAFGKKLVATLGAPGIKIPPGSSVSLRFRQGGELIRLRQQTKTLKKLFQEWKIPTWLRDQIPLIFIEEDCAMVLGFAIHDAYYSEAFGNEVYQLEWVVH